MRRASSASAVSGDMVGITAGMAKAAIGDPLGIGTVAAGDMVAGVAGMAVAVTVAAVADITDARRSVESWGGER
jgi:hypothetical protein